MKVSNQGLLSKYSILVLIVLTGCSNSDACKVSGEWVQARFTYGEDDAHIRFNDGTAGMNDPKGLLFLNNIVSFDDNGVISGGAADGMGMFGSGGEWIGTNWACQDDDYVLISSPDSGTGPSKTERIKIEGGTMFRNTHVYGRPALFFRYAGSTDETGQNALKYLEEEAARQNQQASN